MNGDRLLLDTNVVINYLKGNDAAVNFIEERPDADLYVSVITRMELLSFHGMTDDEEASINGFLNAVTVIPLDSEVEQIAIALRRATRRKMPDAIVAASAVWLEAPLVTAEGQLTATVYPGLRTVHVPTTAR